VFAWETLQLLQQKAEAGDPVPPFRADANWMLDPRRGGSAFNQFLGAGAAFTFANTFNVPRTGLYWYVGYIAAKVLTAPLAYQWIVRDVNAATFIDARHILTVGAPVWVGPQLLLLNIGDAIVWGNQDAQVAGDDVFAGQYVYEIAVSSP
jgi:hypothetical protein